MTAHPATDSIYDSLQRPRGRRLAAPTASSKSVQVVPVRAGWKENWLRSVIPSNSALWLAPAFPITTTPVTGAFFTDTSCPSGCEPFNTPATQVPVFLQTFPNLMFNPMGGAFTTPARSFADLVLDPAGNATTYILAQGNSHQAGAGDLTGFSAVFRSAFVVSQAGTYTINGLSQDGFIFGASNGAARVSGINVNAPATTPFAHYPVMDANNGPSTGAAAPIVVTFPTAGTYPYEFDYRSGTGGPLSLGVTVTQGTTTLGLRPLDWLRLTSNSSAAPRTGHPAAFTVKANDETGAPIANLPVTVNVSGIAPQTLRANTDATGNATVTYTDNVTGTDVLQASALAAGFALSSTQLTADWTDSRTPTIQVEGTISLQLPATAAYTAAVTDPAAPAGGPITVTWIQTGGPAATQIAALQQLSTSVTYPIAGAYILQLTATDALGSSVLTIGPILVTAADTRSVPQGWLDGISNPRLVAHRSQV